MKRSTKLMAAASIAAGAALGVLFAPDKGSETRKKLKKDLDRLQSLGNGECKKEKLLIAKDKLEKHKERVNRHLHKINSMIEAIDERSVAQESL